jgi:tetratricopeptide (TPR) repeat protein
LTAEYFQIYRQMGDTEKALAMAEKGLQSDPGNVDMLMMLADSVFRKDDARQRERVIGYTGKVIEVLESKTAPEKMSEEDWAKYRSQVLGIAYYMGGVSNNLNNAWARADAMLRAALPYIKDDPAIEATLLYHLGLANYRMADKGGSSRPVDALKFMRRCAAIKSPFQEQAAKNVEAIKSEYNLP